MAIMASKYLKQRDLKFALMPTLTVSIAILVLLSVGSVTATNWFSSRLIVQELASRLVTRVLGAEEMALRMRLDEATYQADFIAAAIRDKRYQFADPALGDFLGGSIAAAQEIDGLILGGPSGSALRVTRGASDNSYHVDHLDIGRDQALVGIMREIGSQRRPHWGPPVYRSVRQATFLNYRVPIWDGDTYPAFSLSASRRVSIDAGVNLSDPPRSVSFMLYGKDWILAHPSLTEAKNRPSEAAPMPALAAFDDRVIANLFNLPPLDEAFLKPPAGVLAREPVIDGERYIVLARQITDYGDLPITVGVYFDRRVIDVPIMVLYRATFSPSLLLFCL